MEKISCNPEGHRKGRKRKADQVKKGQNEKVLKGFLEKRKGETASKGGNVDLVPVNVISERLKSGILEHVTDLRLII